MTRQSYLLLFGYCVAAMFLNGCATEPSKFDYSEYRAHEPRSILVLPPRNQSVDANASYAYLSTVTRPLAECGYYVFPVAVVDSMMKENGLPGPDEMQSVSLDKIKSILGADAVLYIDIEDWGQKYRVLSSTTIVRAKARLVDVGTGAVLWHGEAHAAEGSGDAGAGLIGMLVSAAIDQIVDTVSGRTHALAYQANAAMIFNQNSGFLYGPYSPKHASDGRGR